MISVWTLENTHSSNISETLLKDIQTGSWNWLLCRMGAVGVRRIIPRIRTGLKPFDHQISHLQGWTPSYRRTRASLRPHNLPLSAVQDIPGTGGTTNKAALRTCQLCLPTGWEQKIETNRWRCRKPTGWQAGEHHRRQHAYGHGTAQHPRFFWSRELLQLEHFIRFQCLRK